ncbi:MAG: glycosyltransferase family 2 protein [bacterium]|nr:glycosyltransferase family 2 protein [bacterium]
MDLSIILPTYKNQQKLDRTLKELENSSDLIKEIIIVDDGSDPAVKLKKVKIKTKLVRQKNSGPARARNRGVAESSGKIIMFIGDDILISRKVIEEHLAEHAKIPNLALMSPQKYTTKSIFNDFTIDYKSDRKLRGKKGLPHEQFCTACVSIKRNIFKKFDERFRSACLEDTELGYRLKEMNLGLGTEYVYHDHYYDEAAFRRRQENYGYHFTQIWPAPSLINAKATVFKMIVPVFRLLGLKNWIYVSMLSTIMFNKGLQRRKKELKQNL